MKATSIKCNNCNTSRNLENIGTYEGLDVMEDNRGGKDQMSEKPVVKE